MGSAKDYVENLRNPAITEVAGRGAHAGDPGRRPVLPRPADLRPALRRRPVRARPGHARGLQRQQHRARGAQGRGGHRRQRDEATRSSGCGAPRRARRLAQRRRDRGLRAGTPRCPGSVSPLVNEVVVPTGLKDAFNSISPGRDAAAADGAVVDRVLEPEVPRLIEAIYGVAAPERRGSTCRGLPHRRRDQRGGRRRRRPDDAEPAGRRPQLAGAERRRGGRSSPRRCCG